MPNQPERPGAETYVDSPAFIDVLLGLFALAVGVGAWIKLQPPSPSVPMALALFAVAALCVVAMFAQRRRTFIFDPSTKTLAWTSRGLRERASGTVDFKDVRITLDPSSDGGHVSYRAIITTPQGSWPLTNGYEANAKRVEQTAAHLRSLLGQSPETLLDDSIAQLAGEKNLIAAATVLSQRSGMSTVEAYGQIVRSQKAETP